MNKLLQCMLAASLLFISASVMAETKVGYVQVGKIMQSPQSLDTGKKLQAEFNPRKAEIDRLAKQLDDKEAALNKGLSAMSESERRTKTQALADQKIDLQRKQRELAEDFNIRKNEELSKLQDRINKTITAVAQAEGYDLVVYGNAAYAAKKIDITDKIIKALK